MDGENSKKIKTMERRKEGKGKVEKEGRKEGGKEGGREGRREGRKERGSHGAVLSDSIINYPFG